MTEDQLRSRYAYLFPKPGGGRHYVGHEFPKDGLGIIERLYAAMDASIAPEKRDHVWLVQQKEKWGGLRVYLSVAPLRKLRRCRTRLPPPRTTAR